MITVNLEEQARKDSKAKLFNMKIKHRIILTWQRKQQKPSKIVKGQTGGRIQRVNILNM